VKQTEQNFWLDLGLFVTFLLTIFTGFILWLVIPLKLAASFLGLDHHLWQTIHIYVSLVSIAGIVIHVAWHKTWLKDLKNRSRSSLPRKIKANRVVDRIIWISSLASCVFGIIGWFLQKNEIQVNIFTRLHVVLAIFWLTGIIVHLVFHRKWIFSTIKRNFLNKSEDMEKVPAGLVKE
jgi:hypothetical protein